MEEYNKIQNSKYLTSGGVGVILSNNNTIYKLLFFDLAYYNNIKYYYLLKDKINVIKLFDHFSNHILTNNELENLDKLENLNKSENLNNENNLKLNCEQILDKKDLNFQLLVEKKLNLIYYSHLYDLYKKHNLKTNTIHILKYEKVDNNCYNFFNNMQNKKNDDELNEIFSFFIIWIFVTIYYLNNDLKIFHNDLKLDNILLKKKQYNKNTKSYDISIYKINNIVLYNKTKYDFYLNDFDMMMQKQIHNDIDKIKISINKIFSNNNNKFITSILKKIETIKVPKDIYTKWLNKSTLFRYILTSDSIYNFLKENNIVK